MNLTENEIISILKFLENSTFNEMHLETGDIKLLIKRGKDTCITEEKFNVSSAEELKISEKSPIQKNQEPENKTDLPESKVHQTKPENQNDSDEGLVPIKSPILGIFYKHPEPGAPPYVEVGANVEADTTVCLVEVMKSFNAINAGVSGQIYKICVEDKQLVEFGQTLFLIKPDQN